MKYTELLKTEEAIAFVKETFAAKLAQELCLSKIAAPLAVIDGTGINDDLNGTERPVSFPIKSMKEQKGVVVHSLAKWKRLRLKEYEVPPGKGILTDMRALRPDEDYSPLHSIYVDQWDWEKTMLPEQRTVKFLKEEVEKIYKVLRETEKAVQRVYPEIQSVLPEKITFIQSEELLKQYPKLSAKEREAAIAKKYGAVFMIGIGGKLSDGQPHDGRAADYDDWSTITDTGFSGLNGDLILWHPVLECAFEVSSMGIRVNKESLARQLKEQHCEERAALPFHTLLLSDQLPQSIGGGIGQSRICMFMLKKQHIGEVQVSIWSVEVSNRLMESGITLL